MRKSLTNRLIFLLVMCSTLVIGAGMAIDYRISRNEILSRLQDESLETVNRAIIDLENLLQSIESTTLLLGHVLAQREYSERGLEQLARDFVKNTNDVRGATIALSPAAARSPSGFAPYFFKQDNGELKRIDLRPGELEYWKRDWFKQAGDSGKPTWTEPYFDTEGAKVLMTTFAVPVFRQDSHDKRFLYAIVTADLPLIELQDYLKNLRLGRKGWGMLFSREGVVLGTRNPSYVMLPLEQAIVPPQNLSQWQAMVSAAASGEIINNELPCNDFAGVCSVRLSRLNTTGWPIGVVYSIDEVLEPLREYQVKTLLITLLTILLVSLAVSVIARRLTKPIQDLALATKEISQGNLDGLLPRVGPRDELADLIDAFADMQQKLKLHIDQLQAATANRSRLEGELAAAREIQMALLPMGGEAHEIKERYGLWAKVRPAKTVGGDLYTYHQSGEKLFFCVGDVSDKGVPAALFMARATSLLQHLVAAGETPMSALALLNDELETGNENCMFVTLFMAELDLTNLRMRFASAGHTPPSLVRAGQVQVLPQQDGPALGLARGLQFPENTVQLEPGDKLAIYTDGIDEAFNEAGEMFGTVRFNQQLKTIEGLTLPQAGDYLFQAVDEHAGTTAQSDDITLMLLELPRGDDSPEHLKFDFKMHSGMASSVIERLQPCLESHTLPPGAAMELILVAEEMSTNIEKYSGAPVDSFVELLLWLSRDRATMEFSDAGRPFNPLEEAVRSHLGTDIESAEIGGLGVHLITQLTDEQSYRHEGGRNYLRVTKRLQNGDA